MPPKGIIKTVVQYEREAHWIGACLVHVRSAPRKVWQRRHSISLPSNIFICHTCDTKGCILDEHHFLGTAAMNSADMVEKGRHVGTRGQACHVTPHTVASKRRMSKAHKQTWSDPAYKVKQREARSTDKFKTKMAAPRPKQAIAAKRLWSDPKFRAKMHKARLASSQLISANALEIWSRPGYRDRMREIHRQGAQRRKVAS